MRDGETNCSCVDKAVELYDTTNRYAYCQCDNGYYQVPSSQICMPCRRYLQANEITVAYNEEMTEIDLVIDIATSSIEATPIKNSYTKKATNTREKAVSPDMTQGASSIMAEKT